MSVSRWLQTFLPGQQVLHVKLMGGLGNQMFQYAMAKAVAERTGRSINLDTRFFRKTKGNHTQRQLELHSFNVRATTDAAPPVILKMMPCVEEGQAIDVVKDCMRKGPVLLQGYWQAEQYFSCVKQKLREDFTLKGDRSARLKDYKQAVNGAQNPLCIHVRRGDYVTNPDAASVHGVCALSYYQAAVARIMAVHPVDRCFVFTDDPAWVTANFSIGIPFDVIEPEPGAAVAEDIFMMSLCRHHIVANSSFSWWGAWLARDDGGLTVAPEPWYLNPPPQGEEIVPKPWLRSPGR